MQKLLSGSINNKDLINSTKPYLTKCLLKMSTPSYDKAYYRRMRVFEHQSLRIGEWVDGVYFDESIYRTLARFHRKRGAKYYKLLYKGIQFRHFVGILQVGKLAIEILPKVDQFADSVKAGCHQILLDMLRQCRLVRIDLLPAASQQLRSNSIVEVYFEIFLQLVGQYLQRGIQCAYRRAVVNERVWKGQPDFGLQIQHNFAHAERCFVRHQQLDFQHPVNEAFAQALAVVWQMSPASGLKRRAWQLMRFFPKQNVHQIQAEQLDQLIQVPMAPVVKEAVIIARLLLRQFSPSLKAGDQSLLAILFDMNLLFEEFIYRQLKSAALPGYRICRHQYRPFWRRSYLKPDILITHGEVVAVVDTKWKIVKNATPSSNDLKQAYVYARYFGAQLVSLVYPGHSALASGLSSHFQEVSEGLPPVVGQLVFAPLMRRGRLNRELGKELFAKLTQKEPDHQSA